MSIKVTFSWLVNNIQLLKFFISLILLIQGFAEWAWKENVHALDDFLFSFLSRSSFILSPLLPCTPTWSAFPPQNHLLDLLLSEAWQAEAGSLSRLPFCDSYHWKETVRLPLSVKGTCTAIKCVSLSQELLILSYSEDIQVTKDSRFMRITNSE